MIAEDNQTLLSLTTLCFYTQSSKVPSSYFTTVVTSFIRKSSSFQVLIVYFFSTIFLLFAVAPNPLVFVFKKGELNVLFTLNSLTFEESPNSFSHLSLLKDLWEFFNSFSFIWLCDAFIFFEIRFYFLQLTYFELPSSELLMELFEFDSGSTSLIIEGS